VTNPFLFEETQPWSGGDTDLAPAVTPPRVLLIAAYIALLGACLTFVLPGKVFNIVGYLMSLFLVTGLVLAFRAVDRKRRLAPTYGAFPHLKLLTATPLALSIPVAVIHAYFMAQSTTLA
jgi:hypothetical protein